MSYMQQHQMYMDKRMKAIDNQIEEAAIDLANETIEEVKLEKERKIKKKEEKKN